MSPDEALSAPQTGREGPPGTLAPLVLGDPAEPVLVLRPDVTGQVDVLTAWRTVRLGDLGLIALRDWLDRRLGDDPDRQGATRAEIELWTASGIAQEERVSRRTVYEWIEREDFPEPFARPVGGGPVWEASRVRAWALSRPRPGRPRGKAVRP